MRSPVHSFHLRIPLDLKDKLDSEIVESKKSLTQEILGRIERSFEPDPAMQIADALRPLISSLGDSDQQEAVKLASSFVEIVSRNQSQKRRK